MRNHLWVVCLLAGSACAQTRALILDFSGSMAGFVLKEGSALPATVERLGHILSAGGAVNFYAMSQLGQDPPSLERLAMKQAASRFGQQASFRGNTPLLWTLDRIITVHKATEILLLTDGMEDGGRIEKVAAELTRLAAEEWATGIVAVPLPFRGKYYPEETIPVKEFMPRIRQAVASRSEQWVVREDSCPAGNCYYFQGERPLLFLMLSRSGSVGPLVGAVERALKEHYLKAAGALQIAPARHPELPASATAPKTTLIRVKLPTAPEQNFVCAESGGPPLAVGIRLEPTGIPYPPQPSALRVSRVELLNRPAWAQAGASDLEAQPDGSLVHHWKVICQRGRIWQPSTVLSGRLQVRYHVTLEPGERGWWSDLSAENSWEFPFKVYKLADVVQAVHSTALRQIKLPPVEVSYGMIVHN